MLCAFSNRYFIEPKEELDFEAMFANCENTSTQPIAANPEDGTVDIREMLGKCGRDTEADKPEVIVTEVSQEKQNKAQSHPLHEEIKKSKESQARPAVVLDSGAFFRRNTALNFLTEKMIPKNDEEGAQDNKNEQVSEEELPEVFTCQEVLSEIKDEQTRQYVQNLPFELKVKETSEEALKFVIKFSKETGDYQGLSGTDMRVIALAYYLVIQRGEGKYVRKKVPELQEFKPKWNKDPKKKEKKEKKRNKDQGIEDFAIGEWEEVEPQKPKPKNKKFNRNVKRDFYPDAFLKDLKETNTEAENTQAKDSEAQPNTQPEESEPQNDSQSTPQELAPTSALEQPTTTPNPDSDNGEGEGEGEDYSSEEENPTEAEKEILQAVVNEKTPDTNAESEEEDPDCDDEWITSGNLQKYLHATDDTGHKNDTVEDKSRKISVKVATSDFAMQNVLMQMGIPVVSLEGIEIRKIKRFKLRCDGCKTINKRVDIEFCEKCGGHTLSKVSVFANSNGEITFFKGKRLRKNNRGVQYSIPKPKGGRDGRGLILREDQLWTGQNALKMKQKQREELKIKNQIGNHFDDMVSFEHQRKTNKNVANDLVFGYGRKNPNIPKTKYSKKKRK